MGHLSAQSIPTWVLAGSLPVLPLGVLDVLVSSALVSIPIPLSFLTGSVQSFVSTHRSSVNVPTRATVTVSVVIGAGLDKHQAESHSLSFSSQTETLSALKTLHHQKQLDPLPSQPPHQSHSSQLLPHPHQVYAQIAT